MHSVPQVQISSSVRSPPHAALRTQALAAQEVDGGHGADWGASAPSTPQHAARGPAPDLEGIGSVAAEVAALRGRLAQLGADLRGLGPGATDASKPPGHPPEPLEAALGAAAPAAAGAVAELQAKLGLLERRLAEESAARRAAEHRVHELEARLEARSSEHDAIVDSAAKARCARPACLPNKRQRFMRCIAVPPGRPELQAALHCRRGRRRSHMSRGSWKRVGWKTIQLHPCIDSIRLRLWSRARPGRG